MAPLMHIGERRTVLRLLTNGVYVITARSGGRCGAATITWVSQASFRPPLLMAAIRKESNVLACLRESGVAALHVLGRGQQEMARLFFAPTAAAPGAINGEPVGEGRTGAPVLERAPAYVECVTRLVLDEPGDHALVILEVVEAVQREPVEPLTLAATPWEYGG
ncbi:MAG: flavin reductase family protein [Candidatus Polarisedimenticolia bacterium]